MWRSTRSKLTVYPETVALNGIPLKLVLKPSWCSTVDRELNYICLEGTEGSQILSIAGTASTIFLGLWGISVPRDSLHITVILKLQ